MGEFPPFIKAIPHATHPTRLMPHYECGHHLREYSHGSAALSVAETFDREREAGQRLNQGRLMVASAGAIHRLIPSRSIRSIPAPSSRTPGRARTTRPGRSTQSTRLPGCSWGRCSRSCSRPSTSAGPVRRGTAPCRAWVRCCDPSCSSSGRSHRSTPQPKSSRRCPAWTQSYSTGE